MPIPGIASGRNRYCGPGAIALLTNLSTHDAAQKLRDVTGRTAIRYVEWEPMHEVLSAYHTLGNRQFASGRMNLSAWMDYAEAGIHLVIVTGHWLVADTAKGLVADNHTKLPIPISCYKKRRKIVRSWCEVESL